MLGLRASLVGDGAALPAIASALEDMPASAVATVVVQVPAADDEVPLATAAAAKATRPMTAIRILLMGTEYSCLVELFIGHGA